MNQEQELKVNEVPWRTLPYCYLFTEKRSREEEVQGGEGKDLSWLWAQVCKTKKTAATVIK